ncbi:MAG: PAS domain S-box protein, partial [Candidatus Hydrogenedentes bacterium]|nr:PAS domain S-box protein [Candidatus Hydrogenedentota bacterium]
MKARSKFENKVLLSFAAAIVMVLTIAATMWKASHDAVEAARWVSQTHQTFDTLADARADLYRIESSVRGYLVSENPARLAERDAAISSLETMLQRIKELIGNDSRQTERWKRLRDAVDARLATHADTVMLRKNQGLEAARNYIANTPQREVVRQGSFELLDEMEAEERRLLLERDLEEKRLRRIAIAAALAVTLVLVVLLAATYVLIRGQFAYSRAARERSEEAARARKALLDAADVAIISTDPEGVIRSFNPAAERMLGYAAAELVGSQTPAVVHDPGEIVARARQFSEELGETIAPGFEVFVAKARRNLPNAHEWSYVRKDGGRLQVLLSVSAMRDGAGRVTGFLGVATDITKRKEAEERLQESAVRIQSILNTAVDGIITIDEFGIVETLNPAAARIFGYAAAEVIGQNVKILMPEPYHSGHDGYLERYRATAEARIIGARREVAGRRKDGSTFPMELAVSEMQLGNARYFTGLVRDITERKAAEQALMQERNRLDLALTATGLSMWDADVRSGQVSLDERWAAMIGDEPEPCVTTVGNLLKLAPASERDRLLSAAADAASGRTSEYRLEHQVRAKNGEWLWIGSYGKVVERDAQGRALRVIGINADITERKQAEQALVAARNA